MAERPRLTEVSKKEPSGFVCSLAEYQGKSPRLNGLQMLQEVGAQIPDIHVIQDSTYRAWLNNHKRFPREVRRSLIQAYGQIAKNIGDEGVHIGRAFYVPGVDEPLGPRTADIKNGADFAHEIEKFFKFLAEDTDYDREGAELTLLTHPFINTVNPPQQESPLKPFAGGAAFIRGDGVIEIHATFGQDESVQSFPHDVYTARRTKTGYDFTIQEHSKKETMIPVDGEYKKVSLDKRVRKDRAMEIDRIAHVSKILRRLERRFKKPFRVEFNDSPRGILFRECTAYVPEKIQKDLDVSGEVMLIRNQTGEEVRSMVADHEGGDMIAYLSRSLFQDRNFRLLDHLGIEAVARNVNLVVLAYGNSGVTGHRVMNLKNRNIPVMFIGEEPIREGESLKVSIREGRIRIEKENPVQWFTQISEDKNRWGGKAVGLKNLLEFGFEIPSGFTVETTAFRRHLEQSNAAEELSELATYKEMTPQVEELLLKVQKKIKDVPLDSKTLDYIMTSFGRLDSPLVSIRSSATCEDEGENAFAGRFESVVGVAKNDPVQIEEAMKDVYASVFRAGVFEDARNPKHHVPFETIEMALACHEMLPQDKQGTLHTTHDGDNVVIEAGQGSQAVDMESMHTVVIKKDSDKVIVSEGIDQNFLAPDEMRLLRDLALKIEEAFDNPQDVEWAFKDGKVVFLQARALGNGHS